MNQIDLDASAADCLIEHPRLLSLFKELGIDYCCGGKSLQTACLERGLMPQRVQSQCQAVLNAHAKNATQEQ